MKLSTILAVTATLAAGVAAAVYFTNNDTGVSDVGDDVVDAAKEVHGERVDDATN